MPTAGLGAPGLPLLGSASWTSCIRIQEVKVLVNSWVYQAFDERGTGGAGAAVLVEDGVAGMGLGAAAAAAGWARLRCAEISLAPSTLMNQTARSSGIGSAGGRATPDAAAAGRLGGVVTGEYIASSSSIPLNPWGTGFFMSRCSGTRGFARSVKN